MDRSGVVGKKFHGKRSGNGPQAKVKRLERDVLGWDCTTL
jgi:hypothetical protein